MLMTMQNLYCFLERTECGTNVIFLNCFYATKTQINKLNRLPIDKEHILKLS